MRGGSSRRLVTQLEVPASPSRSSCVVNALLEAGVTLGQVQVQWWKEVHLSLGHKLESGGSAAQTPEGPHRSESRSLPTLKEWRETLVMQTQAHCLCSPTLGSGLLAWSSSLLSHKEETQGCLLVTISPSASLSWESRSCWPGRAWSRAQSREGPAAGGKRQLSDSECIYSRSWHSKDKPSAACRAVISKLAGRWW